MYSVKERKIGEGQLEYEALLASGVAVAAIVIRDGKCEGYSIVPEIVSFIGTEEELIFLLNWMTARTKGPIVTKFQFKLFCDYGFEKIKGQLVWTV